MGFNLQVLVLLFVNLYYLFASFRSPSTSLDHCCPFFSSIQDNGRNIKQFNGNFIFFLCRRFYYYSKGLGLRLHRK